VSKEGETVRFCNALELFSGRTGGGTTSRGRLVCRHKTGVSRTAPTSQVGTHTSPCMHHNNTILVGSGCKDVHRVAMYVPVYDVTRVARPPQSITNPMQLFWGARATQLWELAYAELLRPIHGHRTPHHMIIWGHVHRCWSTPWEQPTVVSLKTLTCVMPQFGNDHLAHPHNRGASCYRKHQI
jgi:hypothetical protein